MDIFDKCYCYTIAREYMASGYYPYFIPMEGNEGSEAIFKGRRLIMCGSNNYLGLTTHPKVRQAAIDAINTFGTSCTGSRFLNGTLELHEQLERELADWVGKEAALVFSTGMQVNLGTISSIVGRNDVVILDRDDHASIVDGARLGWGKVKRFQHNNVEDLEKALIKAGDKGGILVVVDGLFSMEGDIADLPEITKVCKKYGARLMVDDAHALGVLGGGKGTAAHFGLTDQVDLIMGTFSKSLASLGGFIAGDDDIIHYIKHHARSLIFSASIPPANAATTLAALQVMREEPERVKRINDIGAYMRENYHQLGFNTGKSVSPIIPIFVGDDMRAAIIWKAMFEAGVYVNMVVSPAVPEGKQLLRTSYMATHTDDQLSRVLEIFSQVGKQVGLI
jgi:8-amino-7-oxononanoate synthase